MKPLKEKVHLLIDRSKDILSELENEEPSFEILKKTLDDRQKNIDELDLLTKDIHINQLSDEEVKSLKTLFREFRVVNTEIQQNLNREIKNYRQDLAKATKQRKAEDKYLISEKPDITYFQTK